MYLLYFITILYLFQVSFTKASVCCRGKRVASSHTPSTTTSTLVGHLPWSCPSGAATNLTPFYRSPFTWSYKETLASEAGNWIWKGNKGPLGHKIYLGAHSSIPTLLYSPWEKNSYSKSFKSQQFSIWGTNWFINIVNITQNIDSRAQIAL